MASQTTRFLVISDTHNFQFGDAEKSDGHLRQPLPKCDVLLHCGDLTMWGTIEEFKDCIGMLGQIDAELKLVIGGNHDIFLDERRCEVSSESASGHLRAHNEAVKLWTGPLAKAAGITYLTEGLNTITLQNGTSFKIYTSPYQPEFCGWAFPYERHEDRFNASNDIDGTASCIAKSPIPDFLGAHIVMTHGPPKGILDQVQRGPVGCRNLLRAVSRARPLLHCFGHIHEGYGAEIVDWKADLRTRGAEAVQAKNVLDNPYPHPLRESLSFGKQTLMVNAAIMNIIYRPANAPWLVDLDLSN